MPLFHHNTTASSSSTSPARHSRHDTSPSASATAPTESRRTGLFGSRRHSTSPSAHSTTTTSSTTKSHSGLLHRGATNHEDPSISAAREQVVLAETAERDADRALVAARQAVRDAREHVKRLEAEAKEEARLAKIKQDQARSISKRARPLGRKYTFRVFV
ncbi:hypothetical protein DPV78_007414 [Talaromyces pinophilus]|nr:hypothetical protein DPV78_007414 [Talaromyces pinophilus]